MRAIFCLALALLSACGLPAHAAPPLNSEQTEAAAAFRERLKSPLAAVKELCGVPLELRVDFSNYDKAAWTASQRKHFELEPGDVCGNAVQGIAELCRPDGEGPSKWHDVVARQLKAIDCSFQGYRAPHPEDHSSEGPMRRNLAYEGGVLSFHIHPQLSNVDQSVIVFLQETLSGKGGAPKVSADRGANGASCTQRTQCASLVCDGNTCRACSAKLRCASGYVCESSSGECWTKAALAATVANTKRCTPKAGSCGSDAQCCSKSCTEPPRSRRGSPMRCN